MIFFLNFLQYPEEVTTADGIVYPIGSVRDLTTGYDSSQPDRKAKLPSSKSSEMITFTLENGTVLTLRTSGTEPKMKYYAEWCGSPERK